MRRAAIAVAITALLAIPAVGCGSSSTKTPSTTSGGSVSTPSTLLDQDTTRDTLRDGTGDSTPDTVRDQDRTQLSNP